MKFEYKRVLIPVDETINQHERLKDKKYNQNGRIVNPQAEDTVEKYFNELGSSGWELISSVNLDSGADTSMQVKSVIEYIFKRIK